MPITLNTDTICCTLIYVRPLHSSGTLINKVTAVRQEVNQQRAPSPVEIKFLKSYRAVPGHPITKKLDQNNDTSNTYSRGTCHQSVPSKSTKGTRPNRHPPLWDCMYGVERTAVEWRLENCDKVDKYLKTSPVDSLNFDVSFQKQALNQLHYL